MRSAPHEVAERIHALLKERRLKDRRLSWAVVAARAGVDESWIYQLQNRPKRTVGLDVVEAVAEVLGCHPADLLYPPRPAPDPEPAPSPSQKASDAHPTG